MRFLLKASVFPYQPRKVGSSPGSAVSAKLNINSTVLVSIYDHQKYLSFVSQWDSGKSLPAVGNRPCHYARMDGIHRGSFLAFPGLTWS